MLEGEGLFCIDLLPYLCEINEDKLNKSLVTAVYIIAVFLFILVMFYI